jgi:hypothetical protein
MTVAFGHHGASMTPPDATAQHRRKRYLWVLSTTLCAVLLMGIVVAALRYLQIEAARRALVAQGFSVHFDRTGPSWLRHRYCEPIRIVFFARTSVSADGWTHLRIADAEVNDTDYIARTFGREGWACFVRNTSLLPRVRMMNLELLPISDDHLRALPELPHLQALILSATAVTDDGIATLPDRYDVERLAIARTGITNDAVKPLRRFRRLKMLDVDGTPLTFEAIDSLITELPLSYVSILGTRVTAE